MCTCERHKYLRGWNVVACFCTAALYICATIAAPWCATANAVVYQQFGLFWNSSTYTTATGTTAITYTYIASMLSWQIACTALILLADVLSGISFIIFLIKFCLHLRTPKYEHHLQITIAVIVLQFVSILAMIAMLILFTVEYAVNIQESIASQGGSTTLSLSSSTGPQIVFLWPFGMAWGTLAFNIVCFIIELVYYPEANKVLRNSQLKS